MRNGAWTPRGRVQEVRLAAKGLTAADLMGALAPVLTLPAHPLALPLTREAWRQQHLRAMVPGPWM